MHKEIKLFQVQYDSDPDYIDLLTIYKRFLDNAKTHDISVVSLSDAKDSTWIVNAEHILEAMNKGEEYSLEIKKSELSARVVFKDHTVRLYLQPPLAMKVHIDETVPSPDYVAYLDLLLELMENIRIYGLETNEEMYGYRA